MSNELKNIGHEPMPTHRPWVQFSLSRLLGAMTFLAVSAGILRYTYFEVLRYGGGFYPTLCLLTAIALMLAALHLISPKTAAVVVGALLRVFGFFIS